MKQNFHLKVLVVLALLLAVGRFTIPSHGLSWPGTYEALAHLLIGGWIATWWVTRQKAYLVAVVLLSALELACAILKV